MRIAFACDHAAFAQRDAVLDALRSAGHEILDFGTDSPDSVDYPDQIAPAAEAVADGRADRGVVMCGSGIGASIVANKIDGIRAALVTDPDTAEMSRRHNDSNVLALAGRSTDVEINLEILERWLETPFDGGRHQRRLDKIADLEAHRVRSNP